MAVHIIKFLLTLISFLIGKRLDFLSRIRFGSATLQLGLLNCPGDFRPLIQAYRDLTTCCAAAIVKTSKGPSNGGLYTEEDWNDESQPDKEGGYRYSKVWGFAGEHMFHRNQFSVRGKRCAELLMHWLSASFIISRNI